MDDVMLRFSDDDVPIQEAQLSKKVEGANTSKPTAAKKENEGSEVGPNKPNFVYIVCIFQIANISLKLNYCIMIILLFPLVEYHR